MNEKQNPLWVILCAVVCVFVAIGVLGCLPAWNGMGDMSSLEAIFRTVGQWLEK